MKRTDADEHASNLFQDENLPTTAGTLLDATWLNSVQEEIANTVEGDGIALDSSDDTQLLAAIRRIAISQFTGDRSDGNHTVSGSEALTRNMYYDTLTVPRGTSLNTANWIIRAKHVITESGSGPSAPGTIRANGAIGTAGNGGPGSGGSGVTSTHHYAASAAGASGAATTTNGIAGNNLTFGFGGAGGDSGDSSSNTGASGGTVSQDPVGGATFPEPRVLPEALGSLKGSDEAIYLFGGGAGGAGGAGGVGVAGGGGGAGGGVTVIVCERLTHEGLISADGGAGGDGDGGGGGGGGGVVIIACPEITGAGTVTADGGEGGTGVTQDGDDGDDGQAWFPLGNGGAYGW